MNARPPPVKEQLRIAKMYVNYHLPCPSAASLDAISVPAHDGPSVQQSLPSLASSLVAGFVTVVTLGFCCNQLSLSAFRPIFESRFLFCFVVSPTANILNIKSR